MKLGAQFYTLRDFCKDLNGLEESMKKVADMGYSSIQLSGVCAYEGEWAAEKAKEIGITIDITHFAYGKIVNDIENTIKHHDAMNCKCIGIGASPYGKDQEGLDKFVSEIAPVIPKIVESGHKLMYHNHHWEFVKMPDGKTFLEALCDKFSPEELGITLDTYWVQAGGADPAAWIKKLHGRIDRIHFKDMVMNNADKAVRIAPIGEGNMNYDAIIQACLDENIEYGYVELDLCYGEDPFDCLKRSYNFLSSRYGLK
jgi:sugar phosphate isomerase/epimerase